MFKYSPRSPLLRRLLQEWKPIVGIPLATGVVAFGLTFLIPPRFTAQTVYLPPQSQQGNASSALSSIGMLAGLATGAGSALGLKNPIDQYVSLSTATSILDTLVDRFKLMDVYDDDYHEEARKDLLKRTSVVGGKDNLIVLEVEDTDPKRAAEIANAYVGELDKLLDRLALTDAQQRKVFYEGQVKETVAKLQAAQAALQKSGVGEGTLRATPEAAVTAVGDLIAQIAATEVQLQTLRGRMTDQAPEVQDLQRTLAGLKAQQAKLDSPDTSSATTDYINKLREFKYQETMFETLSKQLEMARLDEANEGTDVQVVDMAKPPERKSSPKRALLSGIAAAVVLLVMLLRLRAPAVVAAERVPEGAPVFVK